MSGKEEEEEVRSLLLRHRERIMLDLCKTDLLAILVKNSVLSQSEEDLLLKTYSVTSAASSAPLIDDITKRKLSSAISSGSGSSNNTVTSDGGIVEKGCKSQIGSSSSNSCSATANGENEPSDNRSITPSLASFSETDNKKFSVDQRDNFLDDKCTKAELNLNSMNAPDMFQAQSINLIEIVAKGGFSKFKQFCYAIDNECSKLIEDLFNDKAKCDAAINNTCPIEDEVHKGLHPIDYAVKENENDRNRRAVSYGGADNNINSLPRAAPRRISLMKDPPPPPPPKPTQNTVLENIDSVSAIPIKYSQSDCNLIQKIDLNSTLTAPAQYQPPKFCIDAVESSANNSKTASNNNYSSLLCHTNSASNATAVRKREKLLHRFSDAATLGRKLKKKKNTNRTCRSMTEAIEMLADPVIEDEFFDVDNISCAYRAAIFSNGASR